MSDPRVAVVVPSHGRPGPLAACLAALARSEGGAPRTIVVDDGSPEPLAPVCAAAGDWVTCLRQDNAGPAAARNAGVRAAEGADILLFTDDDCRPRPDWTTRMVAAQEGVRKRLVGGHVANGLRANLFAETSQSVQTHLYGAFGDFTGRDAFFTSNNLCCRRDDLLSLGGFDASFGFASEDRDLSRRWRDAGGRLVYAPEAVVDHHHRMSARGFARQHWAYGRGAWRFHRKRRTEGGPGFVLNPLAFYAGLLLHPLRRFGPRAAAITLLIGLAHALQLCGYVAERLAERRRSRSGGAIPGSSAGSAWKRRWMAAGRTSKGRATSLTDRSSSRS